MNFCGRESIDSPASNTKVFGALETSFRCVKNLRFLTAPKIKACKIFNFAARKIYDFSTACKNLRFLRHRNFQFRGPEHYVLEGSKNS